MCRSEGSFVARFSNRFVDFGDNRFTAGGSGTNSNSGWKGLPGVAASRVGTLVRY